MGFFDALIEQTVTKHRAALTDAERALLEKLEDDRLAFLDAVANNPSLPQTLRDEITATVSDFKRAENHSLGIFGTAKKFPRSIERGFFLCKRVEYPADRTSAAACARYRMYRSRPRKLRFMTKCGKRHCAPRSGGFFF